MDSYIFGQLDAVRYIEPVNKGFPRPRRGTVYQNSVQTGHWTLYKVRKARTNHIFVNLPWLLNTGRGLVRWLNFCTITMDEISHLRNFRTFDVDAQSCTPTIPLRPCNLTQKILREEYEKDKEVISFAHWERENPLGITLINMVLEEGWVGHGQWGVVWTSSSGVKSASKDFSNFSVDSQ